MSRSSIKASLLLMGITVLICLAVFEVGLRLFYDIPMTTGCTVSHPTRSYAFSRGCSGTSLDRPFYINEHGLRGSERALDKEAISIAVYGDSVAFGHGVEVADTMTSVMERRLTAELGKKVQVLNASVPSYNTVVEARVLEETFDELQPDIVVIQFTAENDTVYSGVIGVTSRSPFLGFFKDIARKFYMYDWLIRTGTRAITRFKGGSPSKKVVAEERRGVPPPLAFYQAEHGGWKAAQAAFVEIAQFCRTKNVPVVFAIYGNNTQLGTTRGTDPWRGLIQTIEDALAVAGIEHTVVLDDAFRAYAGQEQKLWVTDTDHHFSPMANDLAGAAVADYLITNATVFFQRKDPPR